jgi:N utilization substance protein A
MERGSDTQIFAPLPGEQEEVVNPRLADIEGLEPATVAVLEEAGYRTLDDIIDLDREDFLRLAGIAPEEADRLMTIIDELTTEEGSEASAEPSAAPASEVPEPPAATDGAPAESGTLGSDGGAGDATNANDGSGVSDAGDVSPAQTGARKGE